MLKFLFLNGELRNEIISLNENCDILNLDGLFVRSDEGVYVVLETLVLKVSYSVLFDCPSSASSTVLGELLCVFNSEMKSFRAGELVALSPLLSSLNFLELGL